MSNCYTLHMGNIINLDDIYCKASRDLWPPISRLMEFEGEHWRDKEHGKERLLKTRSFLDRRSGKFLCGFLPRVKKELSDKGIPVHYEGEQIRLEPVRPTPALKRTEGTRDDQLRLQTTLAIQAAIAGRGVIQAPTGSGKTTIAMLITSMFYPRYKILFLCHTISLLTQTKEEFERQGFKKIHLIGGGASRDLDPGASVTIATVQSFSKINPEQYCDAFDVLLVDEAHHVNSTQSLFGGVITHLLSPVKIGFTATLPSDREGALSLEGIIGPVIGAITIQEGVDMKIMAKPKVRLVPVPSNSLFADIRKYADLYRAAVVESRVRNSLVAREAMAMANQAKTTLIIVKEILQGENLVDILRTRGVNCLFIQGKTPGETREAVKKQFNQKQIPVVICTAVWKEGVNIPSLDCVINACGGKSEIATLQAIGRGLRAIPGKDTIVVIDFLDPYRYLAQHAIQRLSIYVEAGWL